jgi:hypothetical protein
MKVPSNAVTGHQYNGVNIIGLSERPLRAATRRRYGPLQTMVGEKAARSARASAPP